MQFHAPPASATNVFLYINRCQAHVWGGYKKAAIFVILAVWFKPSLNKLYYTISLEFILQKDHLQGLN